VLEHDELVRERERREPVGDDDRRPPSHRLAQPARILASVVASTLAVASSRIRMRGSRTSARAIATRWRCPPESVIPRSPITCRSRRAARR
jgi:hypothetical protein